MYKSLISLIVISFFVSCSSTVPANNRTKNTLTSTKSVSKRNHSVLGSGKSYCKSNGGSWSWNGKINEWLCKGVDMSSFYNNQNMFATKERARRISLKLEKNKKYNLISNTKKLYCTSNGGTLVWSEQANNWKCKGFNTDKKRFLDLVTSKMLN